MPRPTKPDQFGGGWHKAKHYNPQGSARPGAQRGVPGRPDRWGPNYPVPPRRASPKRMMDAMARVTGDALTLCSVCNRRHTNLALLLGASAPDDWLAVSTGERLEAELTPDVCILPDAGLIRHYIRGHLQLPVEDPTFSPFVWSIWVEVDEESMRTIAQHWSDPNRAAIRPLEGELANELPYAEPTKGLAVEVHTRDMGQAPLIMLARGSEHALAVEQRSGITVHRVAELGELLQR